MILATKSALKLAALKEFFGDSVAFETVETKTTFCQPVNELQAQFCIYERIAQALAYQEKKKKEKAEEKGKENADKKDGEGAGRELIVAIENYFVFHNEKWLDSCLIAVKEPGAESLEFSKFCVGRCVEVPSCLYSKLLPASLGENDWFELGVTGGQLLEEEYGGDERYKADDWFLCAGSSFSRTEQIKMVLGQLFAPQKEEECKEAAGQKEKTE